VSFVISCGHPHTQTSVVFMDSRVRGNDSSLSPLPVSPLCLRVSVANPFSLFVNIRVHSWFQPGAQPSPRAQNNRSRGWVLAWTSCKSDISIFKYRSVVWMLRWPSII